jgi:sec-independent protein translocase protein TatA
MHLFQPWHIIVLVIVVAILFGSKRLPDAARGLGRSLRIFKSEVQQMKEDDKPRTQTVHTEPLEGRIVDGAATRTTTTPSTPAAAPSTTPVDRRDV